MKRAIAQMMTGKDNFSIDFLRVCSVASVVIGLGLAVAAFITGKPFDMQAFGLGVGAMLTAAGIGLKIKETTEPGSSPGVTAVSTSTSTVTETTP